jgi:aminopeptidase N
MVAAALGSGAVGFLGAQAPAGGRTRVEVAGHSLQVIRGFAADVYAEGLNGARFMVLGPGGVPYLSLTRQGRVVKLSDQDGEGRAGSSCNICDERDARRAAWGGPSAMAQESARRPGIDVVSYGFQIVLPDTGHTIHAQATIVFRRSPEARDTLVLNLVGLTVDSVGSQDPQRSSPFSRRPFDYDDRLLRIALPPRPLDQIENVAVFYHGAPGDGLLIRPDGRGREAAFADNWPDRARHWLPTVDDPADKAEVLWLIGAPAGWRVVANGRLARSGHSPNGRSWWAYEEHHPIPTYTLVIGAGRMAVSRHRAAVADGDTVPIEVWTEPEDSAWADSAPFHRATEIVETMQRLVGPFPYEKLAHVESSTRYGGMENSTAIFYAEQPYVARRLGEGVVRHETAHQWFGDAVTERDFHELWLSEGFADYFDLVVRTALDGDSLLARGMAAVARGYLRSPDVNRPVIDTAVTELTRLLNANSYNKGAWVLHMLRGLIGDSSFWRGIRDYYRIYRDSSVTSADFQRVMERASNQPLDWFFTQWLRQPGYPQLDVAWRWDAASRRVTLDIGQAQPAAWGLFRLPAVMMEFLSGAGVLARRTVSVSAARETAQLDLPGPPTDVRVDPDGALLLTAQVRRQP